MILRTTLVAVALLATSVGAAEHVHKVNVGDKVPDFAIQALNGTQYKLSDLRKNKNLTSSGVTVFTFWCSFCGSCRKVEHPLDALAVKYKGEVMVAALDSSFGETADAVSTFKNEKKLTMPIALDPKGEVADLFGAKMTTTTVIIDGEGKLRYFGQFLHGQEAIAEAALESILAGREVSHKQTREHG